MLFEKVFLVCSITTPDPKVIKMGIFLIRTMIKLIKTVGGHRGLK